MTEILLARHGQTAWNVERRWQGHADVPLDTLGRDQSHDLAERLARERFDAVYSSDLRRASETAEVVAARHGLPVRQLRELREIDVGSWSGLTTDEIQRRDPAARDRVAAYGYGWEDGENPDEMQARALEAVSRIAAEHPRGRVLVVAHGGVIKAIRAAAAGVSYVEYRRRVPVVANCEVSGVAVEDGILRSLD